MASSIYGDLVEYDAMGRGNPRGGLWGMRCWNAMSLDHQEQLVVTGKFRGYDGGTCDRPAMVGIETDEDVNPGPRFYCRRCAINFLKQQEREGTVKCSCGDSSRPNINHRTRIPCYTYIGKDRFDIGSDGTAQT